MLRKKTNSSQGRQILQPDSRARIQLPHPFRNIDYFELETLENGALCLYPLKVARISEPKTAKEVWLNPEVNTEIETNWSKNLLKVLERYPKIIAIILFGSRARGDALNTSDFDLAILLQTQTSKKEMRLFEESIEEALTESIQIMRRHQVLGELNLVALFPLKEDELPPAIYFSIAKEGKPLASVGKSFKTWKKEMEELMQIHNVKSMGYGKQIRWSWKT